MNGARRVVVALALAAVVTTAAPPVSAAAGTGPLPDHAARTAGDRAPAKAHPTVYALPGGAKIRYGSSAKARVYRTVPAGSPVGRVVCRKINEVGNTWYRLHYQPNPLFVWSGTVRPRVSMPRC